MDQQFYQESIEEFKLKLEKQEKEMKMIKDQKAKMFNQFLDQKKQLEAIQRKLVEEEEKNIKQD